MKPKQSQDNPNDILENKGAWVRFEYDAQRGSLMGLHDYATRYELMRGIQIEYGDSPAMQRAMAYLLDMRGEIEAR